MQLCLARHVGKACWQPGFDGLSHSGGTTGGCIILQMIMMDTMSPKDLATMLPCHALPEQHV